jgi:hypothetical protein
LIERGAFSGFGEGESTVSVVITRESGACGSSLVIAGLDPAIHLLREVLLKVDGCPDQVRA